MYENDGFVVHFFSEVKVKKISNGFNIINIESVEEGNMVFMAVPVIVGSPETIAVQIDKVAADTGIDGICFSWPDFVPNIKQFGEEVLPRLQCLNTT